MTNLGNEGALKPISHQNRLLSISTRSAMETSTYGFQKKQGAEQGTCVKLNFWLYGCRPAASAWENHYSSLLGKAGFRRGLASPVVFYHPERDVSCVVHGDDFTFEGEDGHLDWIEKLMASWFDIKVRGRLGPEVHDQKEITILGRRVVWRTWGISYEADPKHRKLITEYFGFDATSRKLSTNGSKEIDGQNEDKEEIELSTAEQISFRAVAARLNFLAAHSPDIQFPAKEVCRWMGQPTLQAFEKLKKVARYFLSRQAVKFKFLWQEEVDRVQVYTDSDWACCLKTRRSTSGGRDNRGSLFEDMVIDTGIGGIEFSGGGILRDGGRSDSGHRYKDYVGGAWPQGEHCIGYRQQCC